MKRLNKEWKIEEEKGKRDGPEGETHMEKREGTKKRLRQRKGEKR